MFCDLVGSTAIAERIDPEEYRDLLEQYMAIVFREVYRVEGIITQLAGDGVMALFGAPIAHEDAPYRAVYAALAIRDALAELSARLRADGGVELRVRIGVHTGPVVVGTVGSDLKMDYTAIGDTTNLAQRLESVAEPGTVLISDATHRLVRGFFEVAAGAALRGEGQARAGRRPRGARPRRETTTPMAIAEARGLTPLVGRSEEIAQLLACFDRLAGSLAQVVTIVGDAGSGKSRLDLRAQAAARRRAGRVLRGALLGDDAGGAVRALGHHAAAVLRARAAATATRRRAAKIAAKLGARAERARGRLPGALRTC